MKNPLKICHLSTSEFSGGAGRAAYRIHKEFVDQGFDSRLLVMLRNSDDPTVETPPKSVSYIAKKLLASYVDNLPLAFYKNKTGEKFSPAIAQAYPIDKMDFIHNADLIILYWICAGFLNTKTIQRLGKLGKPIIWRLSDMWPFTGGCHYSGGCEKYKKECGACPQLGSHAEKDISRRLWQKKWHKWKDIPFTIVCPSHWMAQCARESSLFRNKRIEVIPTGVDTNIFKPFEKKTARNLLGLPQDRKLILFGALGAMTDLRKGHQLLLDALIAYAKDKHNEQVDLVILGSFQKPRQLEGIYNVHVLGRLNDEQTISLVYNACDLFLAPSKEENLANTVIESLACGLPCVAFRIGGMPDIIEHKINGYLANPFDVVGFANGIKWVLKNEENYKNLAINARDTVVQKFSMESQVTGYKNLFNDIWGKSKL